LYNRIFNNKHNNHCRVSLYSALRAGGSSSVLEMAIFGHSQNKTLEMTKLKLGAIKVITDYVTKVT
jgi:hypothetical protein